MFLSEFELAPNIVITSLFYLNKSKMDALCMKLIEAGHPVPEPLYLDLFINSLPEEFDVSVNTIDYDMDMVNKVVSSLQIETKRGLIPQKGQHLLC